MKRKKKKIKKDENNNKILLSNLGKVVKKTLTNKIISVTYKSRLKNYVKRKVNEHNNFEKIESKHVNTMAIVVVTNSI